MMTRTELHICEDDFRLLDMVERHVTLQLTFPKALVLPDLATQPSRSRLVTRRTIFACRTWSKRLVPLQMTFPGTFVSPDATSQPPGVCLEALRICEDNFRLPDLVNKVGLPSVKLCNN